MVKFGSCGLAHGTLSIKDGLDLMWYHFCEEYLKMSLFGREYPKIFLLGENLSSFLDFGRDFLKVSFFGRKFLIIPLFLESFSKDLLIGKEYPIIPFF